MARLFYILIAALLTAGACQDVGSYVKPPSQEWRNTKTPTPIRATATSKPTATPRPTATARSTATPGNWTFTPTPRPSSTPRPTPTIPSTPPSTSSPVATGPILITGTRTFQQNVDAGLQLIRLRDAVNYDMVRTYVREIKQSDRTWATGGADYIELTPTIVASGAAYTGSIIIHEAWHLRAWKTSDYPVFGCEGEERAREVQAKFLDRVGEPALAGWIRNYKEEGC